MSTRPKMVEVKNFAKYTGPLLAIGMEDDPWGTRELVDHLVGNFTSAQLERWEFSVDEAGGEIGHLGFFRRRNEARLWGRVGEWLMG